MKIISQDFLPEEGYVIYDQGLIPRTVMNLNNTSYLGSPQEIAYQFLTDNLDWITSGENGEFIFINYIQNESGFHIFFNKVLMGFL